MFSTKLNAPSAVPRIHFCRSKLSRGHELQCTRTFVRSLPTSSTPKDGRRKQPTTGSRSMAAQSGSSWSRVQAESLMQALAQIAVTRPTPLDVMSPAVADITQSDKMSVSPGAEGVALPPVPEAPGYPCPYLSDEEIATYLVPLYAFGWFVVSSEHDRKDQKSPPKNASPVLSTLIILPEDQPQLAPYLTNELKRIQTEENHHCTTDISGSRMTISTHTHSARPLSEPGSRSQPRKRPGITLRDIRLAILIERALQPYPWYSAVRKPGPWQNPGALPRTMEQVENLRFVREGIQ